ncbi:hypothetical protein ACQX0N_11880 [Clostridium tepidum]|uniref:Phage tail protein n=1 Tax=Clostridium tepidum TaxID=1962263 RepID=A0A1S9I964_9CLOT|nr:hypothetical protein [Clostridium tepidum]OOO66778.1 hypothetical protein BS638_06535 [Clostridium tepidum]
MAKCKVVISKKNGYRAFEEGDASKITLEHSLVSVKINRTLTTPVAEAIVVAQYENLPTAIFMGGTQGIVDNFARIEIYIEGILQFTGVIKNYDYNTEQRTIELKCHDMYYRMLNMCSTPLKFNNMLATSIISNVVTNAKCNFHRSGGVDYTVPKLECDIGTMYHDIISNLVATMYARIRATKNGTIVLEDQYPTYTEGAWDENHFDYTVSSDTNLAQETASRDANLLRNILRIENNEEYTLFENESMTTYLNGEKWLDIIENPLATTEKLRQKVAGHRYLDMWRNSTSLAILPVAGIPTIDLGQVIRLISKSRGKGYYLVIGINTEISADKYTDNLQLQGMRDKRKVYNMAKIIGRGKVKQ